MAPLVVVQYLVVCRLLLRASRGLRGVFLINHCKPRKGPSARIAVAEGGAAIPDGPTVGTPPVGVEPARERSRE